MALDPHLEEPCSEKRPGVPGPERRLSCALWLRLAWGLGTKAGGVRGVFPGKGTGPVPLASGVLHVWALGYPRIHCFQSWAGL